MLKIGMVDHYLDEWHATHYPDLLRAEFAAQKLDMELSMAYGFIDKPDGMTSAEWSRQQKVPLASSLEELSEKCDAVMVMAPSFPEKHLEYASPALKAGKPVYIDKIFAPDEAEGKKIFDLAKAHGAPLFSSSALRFDAAMDDYRAGKGRGAAWTLTCGPNSFEIYAIHQMEMLQTVMGRPERVKAIGNEGGRTLLFDYGGGRFGQMTQMNSLPFQISVSDGGGCRWQKMGDDFFIRLVRAIIRFFRTGEAPVPPRDTLDALAMLTAGAEAMKKQDTWIDV